MDELKSKFKIFVQKQQNKNLKIPSMGFTDYSSWPGGGPSSLLNSPQKQLSHNEDGGGDGKDSGDQSGPNIQRIPDQEVLEGIEAIYFSEDPDKDVRLYELQKLDEAESLQSGQVSEVMGRLRSQHKVVSKKVMQMILEQRGPCNEEFMRIGETSKLLEESVWLCRKSRSYMNFAKKQLATSNLEILATYKKRQVLQELLQTLNKIKEIKTLDQTLHTILAEGQDLPGAISLLLTCREMAVPMSEYKCIESLALKWQDTQMMTEMQLDKLLNDTCTEFDTKKYGKLQEAFKLLDKSQITIDQLHINFISQIHSTAFLSVQMDTASPATATNTPTTAVEDVKQKPLFEQLCREMAVDKYIPRLLHLCKSFWKILSCHYQITTWHQNFPLYTQPEDLSREEYIREKLKSGQSRVWNDIQNKICTYLASPVVHHLKFEQFIQVLSIGMRLKKVGQEFCGDSCQKLLDTIRAQSEEYFSRYHRTCLDEIGLFLDNEAWACIDSFTGFGQLQEFRSIKKALRRYSGKQSHREETNSVKSLATLKVNHNSPTKKIEDNDSSVNSQDGGSSIYQFCGYFLRFSDKSSPFDGGFDETMLQEDILAGIGIADETSCYFSDESDNEAIADAGKGGKGNHNPGTMANNTMLTVLRCIGKYLQMCRLLHVHGAGQHSYAPQIVKSLTELIDFYIYVVHDLFAKDLPFVADNIYPPNMLANLQRVFEEIIPKISNWPTSRAMVDSDLNDAESLYGCRKRVVAVESGICLLEQLERLKGYIASLLGPGEKDWLDYYCATNLKYAQEMRKPVYLCIAARFIDIPSVLSAMSKVKWDINHITVQYSPYVDTVNRIVQTFTMRLGEIWRGDEGGELKDVIREHLWDNVAHVVTHVLVEGYSLAKNCSTGGRALMQLDFTHILSFMELVSGYKFAKHQAYVDQYVKAYYLPKDGALKEWLDEQASKTEYSQKQLSGLVLCTCSNDKKMRQKLMSIFAELGPSGSPAKKSDP